MSVQHKLFYPFIEFDSLGKAFKYARNPNVVMNLWKVNEQTTGQIMQVFCKNLSEGMEREEVLRQANLAFL